MAILAGGLIGAAVGSAIGGGTALAIQVGYAVGSYAVASLTAKKQRVTQPSIGDVRVQTSQYGAMIPIIHGELRLAGSIIAAGEKREYMWITNEGGKDKGKGKGGGAKGGVDIERKKYYADFAVALCAGPIKGIKRMWKDGEVVYDLREVAGSEAVNESANGYWSVPTIKEQMNAAPVKGVVQYGDRYVVYNGSQDEADPLLVAIKGDSPSYNGVAYIMFRHFDLGENGQMPSLEFEVVR